MYALDADSCIYWIEGRSNHLFARASTTPPADIVIPSVVAAELRFGIEKSARPEENHRRLDAFLRSFAPLPLDHAAALRYGSLKWHLARMGQLIGPLDMLIAATALANDAILITHNTTEFSRVPGLRYEDWTIAPNPPASQDR